MENKNNSQSRRKFIQQVSLASALLITGRITDLSAEEVYGLKAKGKLRFVLASDFHYGQPNTAFDEMTDKVINQINLFNKSNRIDFCVLNGDIIHNEANLLPLVKKKTDKFEVPYYVVRGNHDMVTDELWNDVWKMPLNLSFEAKGSAFILADTSNERGTYVSPDLEWLEEKLEQYKSKKNVFLILHIPQAKWTKNAIDTPEFFDLIHKYPNIRAGFHGHEHDQDGVIMAKNIPFLFDSHVGGNWGTPYKGFRVVELLNDGTLITYMMNPTEKQAELKY
ncbi:MAG: metallophosphoesterase [Pedobacter sp.]|jgi:3',5'-cyclic AMP phosphodiesterase CpdA